MRPQFLRWRKFGAQVQIPAGLLPSFKFSLFFFFKSYFYPSVCLSLVTLFSFARFLRISSLRGHGGGFSFGGDPELSVSPLTIIIGSYQIFSLSVFISNGPRFLELSSLLNGLPFSALCLSFVVALSPCFTGREQGLAVCSRPTKDCAFAIGRVSWFG